MHVILTCCCKTWLSILPAFAQKGEYSLAKCTVWGSPDILASACAQLPKLVWLPLTVCVTEMKRKSYCFEGICVLVSSWGWSRRSWEKDGHRSELWALDRKQTRCFAMWQPCCWSRVMDLQNNSAAPKFWSLIAHWADHTQLTGSMLCITLPSCL